jgi:hypothetical protein
MTAHNDSLEALRTPIGRLHFLCIAILTWHCADTTPAATGASGAAGAPEAGNSAGAGGSINSDDRGSEGTRDAPAIDDEPTSDVPDAAAQQDGPANTTVEAGDSGGDADGGAPAMPRQVIILKLDDLRADPSNRARFQRVADIIGKKKIKASFGIIAIGYLDDGTKQSLYDWTKQLAARGDIEFWHHGLDHTRDPDGGWAEFANRDLAYQTEHLKTPEDLLKDKCGITLRSFGAPFNANDTTTVEAMKAVPDIRVWMFPDTAAAPQLLLTNRVDMETATGVLDAPYFIGNYDQASSARYMVLQGHPPFWDDSEMASFEQIVTFLLDRGVTFMTPYEYYRQVTGSE